MNCTKRGTRGFQEGFIVRDELSVYIECNNGDDGVICDIGFDTGGRGIVIFEMI